MKVVKNYLYNALYQIFRVLIPFITIPYVSRVLGPQGIGINSYTNSIIQYFVLIGDMGINLYGDRKIAYVRNNKEKLTQTFYEIVIMQICTLAIAYIGFLIFLLFTHRYYSYYWAQSITIIASALDISWFFMGVENFRVTVLKNFIARILVLLCIFMFVKSYNDLFMYILLYASSFLIGNITLYPSLRKYIGKPNISKLHIWRHLKPSLLLFIPEVAVQVYWILNKSMLGSMDSVTDAGYFDQSDKVVKIILAIVTATGTVMLPHVANAFANGKKRAPAHFLYDTFSFITCLSIPLAFGLAIIAPKFVPLFFTKRFDAIIPLMMIESVVVVVIAWSNAIGTQYLLPTKQTRHYTISVIVGAVVNIVINFCFIPLMGAMGAVTATIISECTVTLYQLYSIRDQVSLRYLFRDFYKYLISGLVMFLLLLVISSQSSISWLMIILEIILGIFIYFLVLLMLRANIFEVIKRMCNY